MHVVLAKQGVAKLEKIQIGFIATGNDIAGVNAACMRVRQHAQAHTTTLRDDGYRARLETLVVERAAEGAKSARGDVGNTDAIGADHAHAAFLDRRIEFALHGHTGFANFLEATG